MPDGMMRERIPVLENTPTMEPVQVVFYGEPEDGMSFALYKQTFAQRQHHHSVLEDIEEACRLAQQHADEFGCDALVHQDRTRLLYVDANPSAYGPHDDSWEPWQGAGGQRHESFRWAD